MKLTDPKAWGRDLHEFKRQSFRIKEIENPTGSNHRSHEEVRRYISIVIGQVPSSISGMANRSIVPTRKAVTATVS